MKHNTIRHQIFHLVLIALALLMATPQAEANKRKTRTADNDTIQSADSTILAYNDSLIVAARHIDSIINYGKRFIGTPYRYGGSVPGGFDCSGFMMFIFGKFGHILPHKGSLQYQNTVPVLTENATRGDLIYFEGRSHNKNIGHVGVITEKLPDGSFNFLHSSTSKGVVIDNTKSDYYSRRYLKCSRVVAPFRRSPGEMIYAEALQNDSTLSANDSIVIVYEKQTVTEPAKYHTVKSGETLSSIARKYGTTVANIQKLNKLSGDFIAEKQRLKIRNSYTKTIEVAVPKRVSDLPQNDEDNNTTTATNNLVVKHTVEAGETLTSLARNYKTTVADIQRLNGLTTSSIHAGDVLIVRDDSNKANNTTTTNKNNTENQTTTETAALGEKQIEAPQPEEQKEVKPTDETAQKTKEEPTTYTVKQGDTLWKIAKAHNTTAETLKQLNNLTNDHLSIGQKLKLK
ncbi:MAG: LysM peptidoglycan-binding domain-containing protein [Bacteroidales bacterium]|nr:LysM peptidoglycan-binding domain-containing protein [Bacteroidales bacterium]